MTAIATITDSKLSRAGLYRLLTWLSPSYPIGAYSYSHGIEYAVEAGLVTDRDSLVAYVANAIERGAGLADSAILAAAWTAARDGDRRRLDEVVATALAWRGTAEMALEAETQGRGFLSATRAAWPHEGLEALARRHNGIVALPVTVGVTAALHGIGLPLILAGYLHGFGANLVSAGVRLIPLGQTDGQRAVAALEASAERAAAEATETPLDEIVTSTPLIDWCSMRHETQYTRLFRS